MLSVLIRKNSGHGLTATSIGSLLSFMENALNTFSEESDKLVEKMEKFEKQKTAKKPKKAVGRRVSRTKKVVAPKASSASLVSAPTATAAVIKVINQHRNGVGIPKIKDRTGFDDKKIRNIVHTACKKGLIKRSGRGIYIKA
jgi:predicted transcriptional regulator